MANHMHRNPDETDRFLDFHYIADDKVGRELFDAFGTEAIPAEVLAEKKTFRDAVKAKIMRDCPTKGCDKQIPAFS